MKRLIRGLARPDTFMPLLAMLAALFIVASGVIRPNTIAIIINGTDIAGAILVFAAYFPPLLYALRNEYVKRDQNLLMGILTLWTALAASRAWSIALIMAGKPPWMINHWFQTYCYLVAAMSVYYFLKVPGMKIVGFRYTIGAAVLAVLIITVTLAFFEA